jgi:copper chaperone
MLSFEVNDMTCGHCANAISKAIRDMDGGASVEIDLRRQVVLVEPAVASAAELREAIAKAVYTPRLREEEDRARSPGSVGCCCSADLTRPV